MVMIPTVHRALQMANSVVTRLSVLLPSSGLLEELDRFLIVNSELHRVFPLINLPRVLFCRKLCKKSTLNSGNATTATVKVHW